MQLISGNQPFAEYKEVTVTDPLRQGDVIEAVDENAIKWQRHLLVITADCDFANEKNQGRVTCVPLLTQDEYILEFQIPRIREKVLKKSVDALQVILSKAGGPSISPERLREWPLEQEPTHIVNALRLDEETSHGAEELIDAIRKVSLPPADLDEAVQRLVSAQVDVPNGKSLWNAKKDVVSSLRSHYSSPPGDALFLSAVAPDMQDGYFVYLRHLEQISQPDIALGPTRSPASYRRLARLHDRFIHAVSQQFASVFMAIGLPNDYEEMRDIHSELLGERYK